MTKYPTSVDDIIEAGEAREILRCSSDSTWESWHRRKVIAWFVPPGTNKRLYSRDWCLKFVQSGERVGE